MQTKAKQIKFYFERIYGMGSDEVRSFDCWLDTQGPFLLLDQSNQGAAGCAPYISGQTLVSKALCNYAHPIQVNEKKKENLCTFLHTTSIPHRDTVQTTSSNGGVTKNNIFTDTNTTTIVSYR